MFTPEDKGLYPFSKQKTRQNCVYTNLRPQRECKMLHEMQTGGFGDRVAYAASSSYGALIY